MTAGRNVIPIPNTYITTRPTRSKKYRLGERRYVKTYGVSQRGKPVTWADGIATLMMPSGNVTDDIPVTPTTDGEYGLLVDFDEPGQWEIVFTYGTSPTSASEIIKDKVLVRVV